MAELTWKNLDTVEIPEWTDKYTFKKDLICIVLGLDFKKWDAVPEPMHWSNASGSEEDYRAVLGDLEDISVNAKRYAKLLRNDFTE